MDITKMCSLITSVSDFGLRSRSQLLVREQNLLFSFYCRFLRSLLAMELNFKEEKSSDVI